MATVIQGMVQDLDDSILLLVVLVELPANIVNKALLTVKVMPDGHCMEVVRPAAKSFPILDMPRGQCSTTAARPFQLPRFNISWAFSTSPCGNFVRRRRLALLLTMMSGCQWGKCCNGSTPQHQSCKCVIETPNTCSSVPMSDINEFPPIVSKA
jgi:hypothetical protein